jgi:DNA-binding PadR family transcriptional regulator
MKRDEFAKNLAAGAIGLIVLDVLRDGPSYGYGIRQRICDQSNHTLQWPEGSLYRVLRHLEAQGLVTSTWQGRHDGRRRRYYSLSAQGRRVWHAQRQRWLTFASAMNSVLALHL